MRLSNRRRIVACLAGVSKKRVWFDSERLEDIKSAITKADIRGLIKEGAIRIRQKRGVSRARAKKRAIQKSKGKQRGEGSVKGARGARLSKKRDWILRVRSQREFLNELRGKDLISKDNYKLLRQKIKGGLFRSRRHIKLFMEENKLFLERKDGK